MNIYIYSGKLVLLTPNYDLGGISSLSTSLSHFYLSWLPLTAGPCVLVGAWLLYQVMLLATDAD
jgi:hypothetical protein